MVDEYNEYKLQSDRGKQVKPTHHSPTNKLKPIFNNTTDALYFLN